jgi:hypothetical protein
MALLTAERDTPICSAAIAKLVDSAACTKAVIPSNLSLTSPLCREKLSKVEKYLLHWIDIFSDNIKKSHT